MLGGEQVAAEIVSGEVGLVLVELEDEGGQRLVGDVGARLLIFTHISENTMR